MGDLVIGSLRTTLASFLYPLYEHTKATQYLNPAVQWQHANRAGD